MKKDFTPEDELLFLALGGVLGLLQADPTSHLQGGQGSDDTAGIDTLILQRNEAKKARDFATADRIRNDLLARGIVLKDSAAGTTWERA